VRTRGSVRQELRSLLADLDCITLYVTHDPRDALVLGQRVAAMEDGRVTQEGSREDLLHHPRSPYVAAFVGVHLFQGRVEGTSDGLARVRVGGGLLEVADSGLQGDVYLALNPREVTLYLEQPVGSARNTFRGRVVELAAQLPDGERVRVALATDPPLVAEVTRSTVQSMGLAEGQEVYAAFKATAVVTYG